MIVCLCKGVGCGRIRAAVRAGAASVEDVSAACGAGSDCGGCLDAIAELVDEELELERRERVSLPLALTG